MQSALYAIVLHLSVCLSVVSLSHGWISQQENHAIAKMTARCAQYVSALKIVGLCKRRISRRLRKNLHITILSLFGGAAKLCSKYSIQCDHGT